MHYPLSAKATFISITPHQRQHIERLIESLIAMLDMVDGNEHDEDDGCSEPYLGWPQEGIHALRSNINDDIEVDDDFELDAGEEPEWDQAEDGIADIDALQDENLYCLSFAFDKSGREIAERLLAGRIEETRIPFIGPDGCTYLLGPAT